MFNTELTKCATYFKKTIAASKVSAVPELLSAHSERGLWLTIMTSFKEIPDTFLQLTSTGHNI
jgi:hypothetical protein